MEYFPATTTTPSSRANIVSSYLHQVAPTSNVSGPSTLRLSNEQHSRHMSMPTTLTQAFTHSETFIMVHP
jgi:hypothetical protein